ncbi:hypothetical protein HMPREF0758_1380 [Serratia odorifera DSM 4582]|uniref:Uncharacterized protein n=1 Tax=Serratia odorifera DSM 4582 TaxID=667129 RepID=D4DZN0_SEROD|nr:hypothetical protein HMPREF0758_1380 [Serratia odorifera DSM 4582]
MAVFSLFIVCDKKTFAAFNGHFFDLGRLKIKLQTPFYLQDQINSSPSGNCGLAACP